MNLNDGKIWPYTIAVLIAIVFGFCVLTVYITNQAPIEKSDLYMSEYHKVDANANKIIKDKIAFDKKYNIEFLTDRVLNEGTVLKYKITDKNSNPIKNAKIKVIITRPDEKSHDIELKNPKYENGIYVFKKIKLPLKGRWDIMAKIEVEKFKRFYNLKTDTRYKTVKQY